MFLFSLRTTDYYKCYKLFFQPIYRNYNYCTTIFELSLSVTTSFWVQERIRVNAYSAPPKRRKATFSSAFCVCILTEFFYRIGRTFLYDKKTLQTNYLQGFC